MKKSLTREPIIKEYNEGNLNIDKIINIVNEEEKEEKKQPLKKQPLRKLQQQRNQL